MSEKENGTILHVKIGHLDSLTKTVEANLLAVSNGKYQYAKPALFGMRMILQNMEPKDRKPLQELEKSITDEWLYLAKIKGINRLEVRTRSKLGKYMDWQTMLQDALWNGGYWSIDKYQLFHDPSGGKRSG